MNTYMSAAMFFVGCLFFMLLCFVGHIYMHELAHVEFFRHGGVESYIDFDIFKGKAFAVPFVGEQYDSIEDEYIARISHNMNEAIGYQLPPLFLAIMVILIFGFIYLGSRIDRIGDNLILSQNKGL